jgi:type I restriction enzyme S subunit
VGKGKMGVRFLGAIREAFEESNLPYRVDVLDWFALTPEFQAIIEQGYEVIYSPRMNRDDAWPCVRLGDAAEIIMGQSPKSEYYNTTGDGIPFLQGNRTFGMKYPTFDTFTTSLTKKAEPNDIIMSVRAPVGEVNITPITMCLGRGVCALRMKNKEQEFLYYLIKANTHKLLNKQSGTIFGSVNHKDIYNLDIHLPPLPTQRVIAATLSCLDDKIELNNRINANLEAQAQAIFKSWFVDFEPFADGEFIDSELGRIPKGWRVGTLNDLCFYSDTKMTANNLTDLTYISTENMLPDKAGYTRASSLPSIAQAQEILQGDILVSNIRPYFKKIVFCTIKGGCSADVLCFRPSNQYFSAFIYYTLYNDKFFDHMIAGSKGTKMPRGDKRHIMNYSIIIPSQNELIRFSNFVAPLSILKNKSTIESRTLAAIRDALLPCLMSGEIEAKE